MGKLLEHISYSSYKASNFMEENIVSITATAIFSS